MRYRLQHLVHKRMVRRDLCIPRLHKLLEQHRNDGVQLQIDIVRARQRREQIVDRARWAAGDGVVRAQRAPDVGRCRFVVGADGEWGGKPSELRW